MNILSRYAAHVLFGLSAILLIATIASAVMAMISINEQEYPTHMWWMVAGVGVEIFVRQIGWAGVAFGLGAIVLRLDKRFGAAK